MPKNTNQKSCQRFIFSLKGAAFITFLVAAITFQPNILYVASLAIVCGIGTAGFYVVETVLENAYRKTK